MKQKFELRMTVEADIPGPRLTADHLMGTAASERLNEMVSEMRRYDPTFPDARFEILGIFEIPIAEGN